MISILHPMFQPEDNHRDQSAFIDEIKAADPKVILGWIGVLTALVAGGRWIWNKIVKPVGKNVWNMARIGIIAERIEKRLDELTEGVAAARARTRVLLNTRTDVCIWESNHLGECVFASRHMLDVLNRPFEDVAGHNWHAIIADDDKEAVFDEWAQVTAAGLDFNRSYRWKHRTGSLIAVSVTSQRIVEGGKVLGWICEATVIK